MQLWLEQIEKARERSEGIDLQSLADYARDKTPRDLGTPKQLEDRRNFLRESLGDDEKSAVAYERIIAGSEIQDVNYLARGARAAKAVSRIVIRDTAGRLVGYGTGFLIAPGVLITNNHVLPSIEACRRSEAQFEFELDIDGAALNATTYGLEAQALFFTSKALDFTVVAVTAVSTVGEGQLSHYGFLPLVGATGKVSDGEWLTIIQHPNGDRKQVCVRENKLLKRTDDVLWYSTDTLGGSSGSPVFSNDWYVVALHHSGVPEERDGRTQTISGRDYDPRKDGEQDIKWIANEGIRISRIVETLQSVLPAHPLLQPVFGATPENSRLMLPSVDLLQSTSTHVPGTTPAPGPLIQQPQNRKTIMNDMQSGGRRTLTVTLGIEADGSVAVLRSGPAARESLDAFEASGAKAKKKSVPAIDVPFNATYDDRKGFDSGFLAPGKPELSVHLPLLGKALAKETAELVDAAPGENVLNYHGYSLVMHKARRLALYSAANVDFSGRFELPRPADVWRQDPRIPSSAQLTNFYYENNQFDRGHLTRREDMEYGGSRLAALTSAADTCHWTNCTPQHSKFNQNKELWQGIERHIFEDAIKLDRFRAQVITGPILEESDPVWDRYPKIQYPVRFWKVVAAITSKGALFATAYILDQSGVIDEFGIEAAREVPFDAYKTFQVRIDEVERLTGLSFTGGPARRVFSLSTVDPLAKKPVRRRSTRVRAQESALADAPDGWLPLDSLESMILPDSQD